MTKDIILNVEPDETRVAILEDGELVELYIEREAEQSIVGNIYKGKISSILPGMQAAFVDIGMEKAGFLHVDDVLYDLVADDGSNKRQGGNGNRPKPHTDDLDMEDADLDEEEADSINKDEEAKKERERRREMRSRFRGKRPGIQDILKKGQEILVQIAKDPISTKGPRITTRVSLAGRSLVVMPLSNNIGVSRRIESSDRSKMKQIARKIKPAGMGLIIRTLGSGEGEEELQYEVNALEDRWTRIRKANDGVKAPALLYKEQNLTQRMVRETLSREVNKVVIDDDESYEKIRDFVEHFGLAKYVKVERYTNSVPVFEAFNLEKEIEKALRVKVWLRSGGYLVVEQTEALTVVDVNTGKFIGKKSQDETIFRTNLEAAVEVARQLRLRDIGGIIVIDFIDMEIEDHKEKVYLALGEAIKKDKSKTNILQLTELGLIEMTRKRVKQSLSKELCMPCPYCEGRGMVLSELSTALKVLRTLKKVAVQTPEKDVIVLVHPAVGYFLYENNSRRIAKIVEKYGIKVQVQDDSYMHREDIKILSKQGMAEILVPE